LCRPARIATVRPVASADPAEQHGRASPDAASLLRVAELLAVSKQEIDAARRLLDVFGDPLRRKVFERLALRSSGAVGLMKAMDAAYEDIRHRIRSLSKVGAITRIHDRCYGADPRAANSIRRYLDVLLTITSITQSPGAPRAH